MLGLNCNLSVPSVPKTVFKHYEQCQISSDDYRAHKLTLSDPGIDGSGCKCNNPEFPCVIY